jgi:hypothetical protein
MFALNTVSAPPPPQIKWTSQNLDRGRGVFVIALTAQDAAGGPVTVSMSTQPSGIAKIDKIKGTNFTITVDLSGKPGSVFVKLTVSDQYGGQNTSSKQFNIPQ